MHTFKAEATLVEVTRHIMMTQPGHNEPFVLMTSFPRHVFSAEDSPKTLKELGQPTDWWTCSQLIASLPPSHPLSLSPRLGAICSADSD